MLRFVDGGISMSTVAIIAEYNPFHTGHAYQISEARRLTGADYVLVIMSGDFVQRGAPAVMDKYFRTRLALDGGADFVLELPVWMATSSSADFAEGAIAVLDALGCVDFLCFGSEAGELPLLEQAASLFLTEPASFKNALKEQLSQGRSFPKARKTAWEAATGENGDFLDLPNNILGISYLMALRKLNSPVKPVTVTRKGSFHSTGLNQEYASASAIRKELIQYFITFQNTGFPERIRPYLCSEQTAEWFRQEYGISYPIDTNDFWPVLKAGLLSKAGYAECFSDFPVELANRLKSCHFTCTSYNELAENLKTAAFTRSRIDRCLMHLLLDIKQEDVDLIKEAGTALYARILGFRKSSAVLMKEMSEKSRIPVLTKAMPPENLSEPAAISYGMDVCAANLYESMKCLKYPGKKPVHEYRQKIIVV